MIFFDIIRTNSYLEHYIYKNKDMYKDSFVSFEKQNIFNV